MIIGNIQVAFLTGLSILNIILFDLIPIKSQQAGSLMIIKVICLYAVFAFITTLIREIIKDIEDLKGDENINAKTIPIIYGIATAKWIAIILTFITITGLLFFQYFQYSITYSQFEQDLAIWSGGNIAFFYSTFSFNKHLN